MTGQMDNPMWYAVFAYSEWLDSERGLTVPPDDGDERTHEDLVNEFFAERDDVSL